MAEVSLDGAYGQAGFQQAYGSGQHVYATQPQGGAYGAGGADAGGAGAGAYGAAGADAGGAYGAAGGGAAAYGAGGAGMGGPVQSGAYGAGGQQQAYGSQQQPGDYGGAQGGYVGAQGGYADAGVGYAGPGAYKGAVGGRPSPAEPRRVFQKISESEVRASPELMNLIHEAVHEWRLQTRYRATINEQKRLNKISNTSTTFGVGAGLATHIAARNIGAFGRTGPGANIAKVLSGNRFVPFFLGVSMFFSVHTVAEASQWFSWYQGVLQKDADSAISPMSAKVHEFYRMLKAGIPVVRRQQKQGQAGGAYNRGPQEGAYNSGPAGGTAYGGGTAEGVGSIVGGSGPPGGVQDFFNSEAFASDTPDASRMSRSDGFVNENSTTDEFQYASALRTQQDRNDMRVTNHGGFGSDAGGMSMPSPSMGENPMAGNPLPRPMGGGVPPPMGAPPPTPPAGGYRTWDEIRQQNSSAATESRQQDNAPVVGQRQFKSWDEIRGSS